MTNKLGDQISVTEAGIFHRSAGGFVFFEDPTTHELFVALIKQKGVDGLLIPKGHLNASETPIEAAIREIREELSLSENPRLISELGMTAYSFYKEGDPTQHHKVVYLFVFSIDEMEDLEAPKDESIEQSLWVRFDDALDRLSYDKDSLLEARQLFYFLKKRTGAASSISVGIPTFNGEKTIFSTLTSVLDSLKPIPPDITKEIIVCLDHCSDDTRNEVLRFKDNSLGHDIPILMLDNPGAKGKSSAMNHIFKHSDSDLIHFVDDDVILDRKCISELIRGLLDSDCACVFSKKRRSRGYKENINRQFWREVFGVKFDVQPYERPSELLLGGSLLIRRGDYVKIPERIANEDQFIQYIYWPKTKQIDSSSLYFNSVNSISDYYKRFIRIKGSSLDMNREFSKKRGVFCSSQLRRKIDYAKVFRFPLKQLAPFMLYRFFRFWINLIVSARLRVNKDYSWNRVKQDNRHQTT